MPTCWVAGPLCCELPGREGVTQTGPLGLGGVTGHMAYNCEHWLLLPLWGTGPRHWGTSETQEGPTCVM